jgi:hypothetical protein
MNELANDLLVHEPQSVKIPVQLLVSILGELHAIRLQMNELIVLGHGEKLDTAGSVLPKRVASHYEGMFEAHVSQTKAALKGGLSA